MIARAVRAFIGVGLDDRARDIARVVLPNCAVLATISLGQVNVLVSITAGLFTIAYTAWRWRQGVKRGRPNDE